ncbi:MAG: AMP-binding protein, partial [Myxococcales bacterium]|nr:AMP-binding protein [Myxococcales bacterium]
GRSRETAPAVLEDARSRLQAPFELDMGAPLPSISDRIADVAIPSSRFAVETALLELVARRCGEPVETLLGAPLQGVRAARLLGGEPSELHVRLRRARDDGVGAVKVKLDAGHWRARLHALREARRVLGDAVPTLRADANGAIEPEHLDEALELASRAGLEWLEDPSTLDALERLDAPPPVPIAIDEPLADEAALGRIERLVARGLVRVVVLKPTLLGGVLRCMDLARSFCALGAHAVASHAFEGPVGRRACLRLARWIDAHARQTDRAASSDGSTVAGHTEAGGLIHGVALEPSPLAYDDPGAFCVEAAATEHPDGLALVGPDASLEWRALRAAVAEAAVRADSDARLVVEPVERTARSVVRLLVSMQRGQPVLPLSARAPESQRRHAEAVAATAPPLHEAMFVVRTSGTSGQPRHVVLPRAAMLAAVRAAARRIPVGCADRWLVATPLSHVAALAALCRVLYARGTLVLAPDGPFDPRLWVECVLVHRVTLASIVPAQLERLVSAGLTAPPSMRALLVGGDAAPLVLLARARALGWPVRPTYGMTEACSQIATAAENDPLDGALRPLDGVEVRVRNGAIEVRGPMLAEVYLDVGRLLPVRDADGWLVTRDGGRLEGDGRIRVLGRLDDVIVTGGHKVHPLEVERALADVAGDRALCAFGIPDARWGQRVVLAVEGQPVDAARILQIARVRLAAHARPREVVSLDAFARTPAGKLDRRATAALAARRLGLPESVTRRIPDG